MHPMAVLSTTGSYIGEPLEGTTVLVRIARRNRLASLEDNHMGLQRYVRTSFRFLNTNIC